MSTYCSLSARQHVLALQPWFLTLAAGAILVLGACSDDTHSGLSTGDTGDVVDTDTDDTSDTNDSDTDVSDADDTTGGDTDSIGEDADASDTDTDDTPDANDSDTDVSDADDTADDDTDTTPIDPACDQDGDGYLSIACGGNDCDDNNPHVNPGATEVCDEIDNNCDEQINEGLDCTFYVNTDSELFRLDPFRKEVTWVAYTPPFLLDIDVDESGTLWGTDGSFLFRLDEGKTDWEVVGDRFVMDEGHFLNGLAINTEGRAVGTGISRVYEVDLEGGSAVEHGQMGGDFLSSGDCVFDRAGILYMSSYTGEATPDLLVRIDLPEDGVEIETIGDIGFAEVWGLSVSWGRMFGLTSAGELLEIDVETGEGSLLHVFDGRAWYGAANALE